MERTQAGPRRWDRHISRGDVEDLIAQGRQIVIIDGRVLKVDAWLPYHPGGDKAIRHMVGRDATNEVRAFHSLETQQFMHKYQIGRIAERWIDFVPPIQGGTFKSRNEQHSSQDESHSTTEEASMSSEEDRSEEPSPIFDPVDSRGTTRRRRQHSPGAASESSVTSLETLDLGARSTSEKKDVTGADRTRQELEEDLEAFPSLDPDTQAEIVEKYRELEARIRAQQLYDCNYSAYAIEATRYITLAALSYFCLQARWHIPSAIFLGMLWHQLTFTVHDAGHMGITHDFHIDSCIGIVIADFLGGLSCCWWKRNHNVHHIVTNSAEHDPDIQHMPFFAISHRFFESLRSTYYDRIMTYDPVAKFMLRYQHWLYYPILTLGRFNLYVLSWQYIILGQGPRKGPAWWHRYLEMTGQVFFWYWYGYLLVYRSIPDNWSRFAFFMISHMVSSPVHVQITLSHFAMSTADLGVAESFPQRMLRTTMDVDCPPWLDFFHGGLQFQVIHHLFPRIPRHNLRKCQVLVREFCEETGIPYAIHGFKEGNEKVIGHLGAIAHQARLMAECQRSMAPADVWEGH